MINVLIVMQAMSGIEVDSEIPALFNEMKLKHTQKWATFKIEGKKKIITDENGEKCETDTLEDDKEQFQVLKEKLKVLKEPRYVLYDFRFTNKEGRIINKLAFIF